MQYPWDYSAPLAGPYINASGRSVVPPPPAQTSPTPNPTPNLTPAALAAGRPSLRTRILILEPGIGDEMLQCRRESIAIDATAPIYEALSYRWGHELDWPLLCDGHVVMINQNLADVLRHLRRPDGIRRLWVDFICINQKDEAELSAQVRIMRHIYKQAARVLVWTGNENECTAPALEVARLLVAEYHAMPHEEGIARDFQFHTYLMNIIEGRLPDRQWVLDRLRQHLQELQRLLGSEWFSRVWCIQEAVVSSTCVLMSGDQTMDFFDFINVVPIALYAVSLGPGKILDPKRRRGSFTIPLFWAEASCRRKGTSSAARVKGAMADMLSLLYGIRDFGATKERDKIFALLGISDEGLQAEAAWNNPNTVGFPNVAVEYQQSTTNPNKVRIPTQLAMHPALLPDCSKGAVQVYEEFTRFMIRWWQGLLDVLSHVQHQDDSCRGSLAYCPSWVPDWSQPLQQKVLLGDDDSVFRAHGEIPAILYDSPLYPPSARPEFLCLEGFRIDRVRSVSSALNIEEDDKPAIDVLWMEMFNCPLSLSSTATYRDGQPLEAAFCMTLIAGYFGLYIGTKVVMDQPLGVEGNYMVLHAVLQPAVQDFAASISAWKVANFDLLKSSYFQPPPYLLQEAAGAEAALFESLVSQVSFGRRLFQTDTGYLGLGPKAMRVGDLVCVLFGGRVPFVLRPTGTAFMMVGEAYVHDDQIMWGNAARSVFAGAGGVIRRETFYLI